MREWPEKNGEGEILYFEDQTGGQVDFDIREAASGAGRPKLGVVSREISEQPNGASAVMRREGVLSALAGNYPGFEEATRAVYSGPYERMGPLMRDDVDRLAGALEGD